MEHLPEPAGYATAWERVTALDDAVQYELRRRGAWLESYSDYSAVIVRGRRISYAFHTLATVATCWLWFFLVFLPCLLFGGQRRIVITVDPYGDVWTRVYRVG